MKARRRKKALILFLVRYLNCEKFFIPADPVRSGYEFGGWYKEAECVNAWGFEADTLPELQTEWVEAMWTGDGIRPGDLIEVPKYQETILYAKWTKKNDAQI